MGRAIGRSGCPRIRCPAASSRWRDIRASLATVWVCLIEPELIAQWFFAVDFSPVAGHRFRIAGEAVAGWRGGPRYRCSRSSLCSAWSGHSIVPSWPRRGRVVFNLTEHAGFVRLVLTHDGLVPEPTLRLLDAGWRQYTGNLVTIAETL
ncbi:hypothetical protein CYK37_06230 [Mesorhizobium loti]|nr:hypothetical protein CYK37_06230 [Mesorhizobium loti]